MVAEGDRPTRLSNNIYQNYSIPAGATLEQYMDIKFAEIMDQTPDEIAEYHEMETEAFLLLSAAKQRELWEEAFGDVMEDAYDRYEKQDLPQVEAHEEKTVDGEASPSPLSKVENPLSAADGQEVNTDPSEAQKEAENYKKAHIKIDGMDVSIENPQGSTRRGKDASGKEWESEMKADYGYIRGTRGYDKDHVDVFIAPGYTGGGDTVYVVNQVDPKSRKFDEHKVVFGAATIEQAEKLYLANYEAGWTGAESVVPMALDEFKQWVKSAAPAKGALEIDKSASPEANLAWWTAEAKRKLKILRVVHVKVKRNDSGTRWMYSIGDDHFVLSPMTTKIKTSHHAEKERNNTIKYMESGAWARSNSDADWRGHEVEMKQAQDIDPNIGRSWDSKGGKRTKADKSWIPPISEQDKAMAASMVMPRFLSSKSVNASTIAPHRVGSRFTDEQKAWLQSRFGLSKTLRTYDIDGLSDFFDQFDWQESAGDRKARVAREEYEAKEKARRGKEQSILDGGSSTKWIDDTFGSDA